MNAVRIHTIPKLNPNHIKELLHDTNPYNTDNLPISKKRIYDDPGEVARVLNKRKRMETNKRFNDEYFKQFHS